MCENVGLEIMSLRRVAIGDITLGTLKPGEWRELSGAQVHYLKNLK
jgi:23S rRNA pseudouridine2605 synthase